MSKPIYPWQESIWNTLRQQDKLHHAILLTGEEGVGKQLFATSLAQSLLCQRTDSQGFACLECQSCHWFANQTHPDFQSISIEDEQSNSDEDKKTTTKKTQISVDQIRALNDFLAISSHQGKKVVLINPAEDMNLAATNALLKMLEEPPNNTFFILVSHSSKRLLPTILSRCQQVNIYQPDYQTAKNWLASEGLSLSKEQLQYVAGSPLKGIQLENFADCMSLVKALVDGHDMDISKAVSCCQSLGMADSVSVLQKWLHDLLASKADTPVRYHSVSQEKISELSKRLEYRKGFDFLDQLNYFKRHAQHPLNQELQFESMCIKYTQIFKDKS